jgi:hypothetical protein
MYFVWWWGRWGKEVSRYPYSVQMHRLSFFFCPTSGVQRTCYICAKAPGIIVHHCHTLVLAAVADIISGHHGSLTTIRELPFICVAGFGQARVWMGRHGLHQGRPSRIFPYISWSGWAIAEFRGSRQGYWSPSWWAPGSKNVKFLNCVIYLHWLISPFWYAVMHPLQIIYSTKAL